MWNARDAARKAKRATAGASGAPSPKKPRTQPAAQADDAGVEPEVAEKPPSLVKSKRSSLPVKSKSKAYGRKEEHVKKNLKELGDLGLVAKASRSSQKMMYKPKPLTIARVLTTPPTIARVSLQKSLSNHTFFQESGKDSQDKKRSHIKGLLVAATDCEPQYF